MGFRINQQNLVPGGILFHLFSWIVLKLAEASFCLDGGTALKFCSEDDELLVLKPWILDRHGFSHIGGFSLEFL